MAKEKKTINFTTLILAILLVVAAFFLGMYMERNNKLSQNVLSFKETNQPTQAPTPTPASEPLVETIGRFSLTQDEVCQEDGKPLIYYFGYSGCPHCSWNHPIIENVAKKFPTQIVFHDNMDKLEQDQDVQTKYASLSQGAVPFFVFGCRYVRLGSGEDFQAEDGGKAAEEKNLTALICKLTNNQPEKVCAPVKDLIDQIK